MADQINSHKITKPTSDTIQPLIVNDVQPVIKATGSLPFSPDLSKHIINGAVGIAPKFEKSKVPTPQIRPKENTIAVYFLKISEYEDPKDHKWYASYWVDIKRDRKIDNREVLTLPAEVAIDEKALESAGVNFVNKLLNDSDLKGHFLNKAPWSVQFGGSIASGERSEVYDRIEHQIDEDLKQLAVIQSQRNLFQQEELLEKELKAIRNTVGKMPMEVFFEAAGAGGFFDSDNGGLSFNLSKGIQGTSVVANSVIFHELLHAVTDIEIGLLPGVDIDRNGKGINLKLDYSGIDENRNREFKIDGKTWAARFKYKSDKLSNPNKEASWEQLNQKDENIYKASRSHNELRSQLFTFRYLFFKLRITQPEIDNAVKAGPSEVNKLLDRVRDGFQKDAEIRAYISPGRSKISEGTIQRVLAYLGYTYTTNPDGKTVALSMGTDLHESLYTENAYKELKHTD